jgi:hypothetical protein
MPYEMPNITEPTYSDPGTANAKRRCAEAIKQCAIAIHTDLGIASDLRNHQNIQASSFVIQTELQILTSQNSQQIVYISLTHSANKKLVSGFFYLT